jgi:hypothetical protein
VNEDSLSSNPDLKLRPSEHEQEFYPFECNNQASPEARTGIEDILENRYVLTQVLKIGIIE